MELRTAPRYIILFILVLFLASFLAVFAWGKFMAPRSTPSPMASPASDWQTFTNNHFGISVLFPSDFKILVENSGEGSDFPETLLAVEKRKSFPGYNLGTRYIFQIQQIPNLNTPTACYIKTNDSSPLTKFKMINENAFYYSDKDSGGAAGTHNANQGYKVFKDIGDNCFEVNLRYFESGDRSDPKEGDLAAADQKEAFEILEQILSTFEFIN
ncbi:hypothetical protein A2634_01830 [Candidatus Amesbacteria bacterium RIFCSPHIGHO2_01_FULL_48_32]|uniref:Uncharacterized protein n=1 Tax=Candidatus Amesbacteria bacterium RIFCSPLOWO2_01_FULL_48_25 TaxID=1797259 RepID=A0A1F4ZAF6_9BACT|nr:MAG: hypothetical protein A2634_01830 [Candidatus Amesbacteria bacterium RIFCSPHIGHO2_01_FULL_48_32]OGD03399.1 MAG: hypothetical protein A2989_01030 [Candidatus Amesbacteria bacterium RIFCSPLOWO2_01_FULL_48_25]